MRLVDANVLVYAFTTSFSQHDDRNGDAAHFLPRLATGTVVPPEILPINSSGFGCGGCRAPNLRRTERGVPHPGVLLPRPFRERLRSDVAP